MFMVLCGPDPLANFDTVMQSVITSFQLFVGEGWCATTDFQLDVLKATKYGGFII